MAVCDQRSFSGNPGHGDKITGVTISVAYDVRNDDDDMVVTG